MLKEKPMKAMPYEIKQKLRQYAKIQTKAKELSQEIGDMLESYGVPEDNLIALGNTSWDCEEPQTEGLAFLHNGECSDLEETIKDIERVFLYFVNRNSAEKS